MGEPRYTKCRQPEGWSIHDEVGSKEATDRPIAAASSSIFADLIVMALNYFAEYPPGPRVAADLQAAAAPGGVGPDGRPHLGSATGANKEGE